jgi:hypothetical protein
VQLGLDGGSRKLISELRDSQKIEWSLHLDLPFRTTKIQGFDQKEVLQLLPESGSEKARK